MAQNSKSGESWVSSLFLLFVALGGFWWVADYAWDKVTKLVAKPGVTSTAAATGSASTAAANVAPKPPQLLEYPAAQLDLSDLTMSKSRAFIVTRGDLRPLWTVRGRIKNRTVPARSIKEVQSHIRIYDALGEEADSAQLHRDHADSAAGYCLV